LNRTTIAQVTAIIFAVILILPTAAAQTSAAETVENASSIDSQRAQAVRKLHAINAALTDKREQVRNLLAQLETANEADKEKLRKQIAALQQSIRELTESFEKFAVNGINLRNLAETEDQELDWRDELMQIVQPILNSLKEATEKPRRIEELRTTIALHEQQLEVISRATDSIALLDQHEMSPAVATGLDKISASWNERRRKIETSLDVARYELNNLESEEIEVLETVGRVVHEFVLGRGLTLLLALVTGILVWLIMRSLRRLLNHWRRPSQNKNQSARIRLLLYGYHLLTIVLVALAVVSVLYVRGDVLLLSLVIIALVMLALGVWRFLPGYIEEARLLLNLGAAREGERVIYNGLPFYIASLNLYSELRNPELEGAIRLPLAALAQMTSRRDTDEAWFPCRVGDYLLLPNGSFGHVHQQTIELVRLKVTSSIIEFRSADFLQLNVRNLSQEGFGIIVVFGIDYQHQKIALDRVPERFKEGINSAFAQADFSDDLENLVVEFKQAGTNSLDYLIYATMNGRSAASYFAITRLIQQTCVDICNREGWGIPFTQVTIHQAEAVPADDTRARLPQES
jgi:small-conductance mechanosensitive channel